MKARTALLFIALLIFGGASSDSIVTANPAAEPIVTANPAAEPTPVEDPYGIYGADPELEAVINGLIDGYTEAGLELPALRVYVHQSYDPCFGNLGLFSKGGDLHRVDVCDTDVSLIRHELAHAWERHNVSEATRQQFMADAGLGNWNDHEMSHPSRGVESAADIIAWGSESTKIQQMSAGHHQADLDSYELLTGSASPRISHWGDERRPSDPATLEAMRLAAATSSPDSVRS